MSEITTLNSGDSGPVSRGVLNTNLANLNADKIETSVISTDGTLASNSDAKLPSEKAVKAYVDTEISNTVLTNFSNTEVFNGTAPVAWTDLDLSSVIGATTRVVLLKLYDSSAVSSYYLRPNGDAGGYDLPSPGTVGVGVQATRLTSTGGNAQMLICKTDSAGVIEHYGSGGGTVKIAVLAYW